MQIPKGKIEVRPIGHNGKVLLLSTRDYLYPDHSEILTENFDQLLARCFVEGTDYHCTIPLIKSIQVVITADAVPVRELFADGTVCNPPDDDKEMTVDELYKSFKQSLKEIDLQNNVIDLAVNEVCRCRGAKVSEESIKQGLFERCKT
jgi:hypothetical protein